MKINFEPISTSIKEVIPFKTGYLIREDYYKFEGISNLYFIENGKIIWFAELPKEDDTYTEFRLDGEFIIAFTWSCFMVKLNAAGKIISSEFTK